MDEATMLEMLKVDLGITTAAYNDRLIQYLDSAKDYIICEGIHLDFCIISGYNIVVMYAAWLWRKRDTGAGMPRNIRWALNNRLLSEKIDGRCY